MVDAEYRTWRPLDEKRMLTFLANEIRQGTTESKTPCGFKLWEKAQRIHLLGDKQATTMQTRMTRKLLPGIIQEKMEICDLILKEDEELIRHHFQKPFKDRKKKTGTSPRRRDQTQTQPPKGTTVTERDERFLSGDDKAYNSLNGIMDENSTNGKKQKGKGVDSMASSSTQKLNNNSVRRQTHSVYSDFEHDIHDYDDEDCSILQIVPPTTNNNDKADPSEKVHVASRSQNEVRGGETDLRKSPEKENPELKSPSKKIRRLIHSPVEERTESPLSESPSPEEVDETTERRTPVEPDFCDGDTVGFTVEENVRNCSAEAEIQIVLEDVFEIESSELDTQHTEGNHKDTETALELEQNTNGIHAVTTTPKSDKQPENDSSPARDAAEDGDPGPATSSPSSTETHSRKNVTQNSIELEEESNLSTSSADDTEVGEENVTVSVEVDTESIDKALLEFPVWEEEMDSDFNPKDIPNQDTLLKEKFKLLKSCTEKKITGEWPKIVKQYEIMTEIAKKYRTPYAVVYGLGTKLLDLRQVEFAVMKRRITIDYDINEAENQTDEGSPAHNS